MIAVQMRQEDFRDSRRSKRRALNLNLCSLAAIEEIDIARATDTKR